MNLELYYQWGGNKVDRILCIFLGLRSRPRTSWIRNLLFYILRAKRITIKLDYWFWCQLSQVLHTCTY
jgi:hypothetical protein